MDRAIQLYVRNVYLLLRLAEERRRSSWITECGHSYIFPSYSLPFQFQSNAIDFHFEIKNIKISTNWNGFRRTKSIRPFIGWPNKNNDKMDFQLPIDWRVFALNYTCHWNLFSTKSDATMLHSKRIIIRMFIFIGFISFTGFNDSFIFWNNSYFHNVQTMAFLK